MAYMTIKEFSENLTDILKQHQKDIDPNMIVTDASINMSDDTIYPKGTIVLKCEDPIKLQNYNLIRNPYLTSNEYWQLAVMPEVKKNRCM